MDTLIGTVPDDWQTRRLDGCCSVQPGPSGTTLKSSDHVIGGIPVVKATDVDLDGILDPDVGVSAETAARLQRYRLQPSDILLVRVGVTTRHAMVTRQQDGWLLGGSCIRLRVETDLVPGYLACYLKHPAVQGWLSEHTRRGVLATLNRRTVSALPLVVPPTAIQRDVVDVAEVIDAKIRAHEDVVSATRTLRELLLPRLLAGTPYP